MRHITDRCTEVEFLVLVEVVMKLHIQNSRTRWVPSIEMQVQAHGVRRVLRLLEMVKILSSTKIEKA